MQEGEAHRLPAPLVRANLSWSANVDVDLHAYDAGGNHSGWVGPAPGGLVQGIPNAVHSPDLSTAGSETFTDNVYVQGGLANREFSYLACFYGDTPATFTGITARGVPSTLPLTGQAGTATVLSVPGGPPTPDPSTVC